MLKNKLTSSSLNISKALKIPSSLWSHQSLNALTLFNNFTQCSNFAREFFNKHCHTNKSNVITTENTFIATNLWRTKDAFVKSMTFNDYLIHLNFSVFLIVSNFNCGIEVDKSVDYYWRFIILLRLATITTSWYLTSKANETSITLEFFRWVKTA